MQAGATRKKIVETILQLVFYAGGPAVRNALVEVKNALATAVSELNRVLPFWKEMV